MLIWVLVGEGSMDEQTLRGKAPIGVARAAQAAGTRVTAVCGRRSISDAQLRAVGIDDVHALTVLEPDVRICLTEAPRLLELVGASIAATLP